MRSPPRPRRSGPPEPHLTGAHPVPDRPRQRTGAVPATTLVALVGSEADVGGSRDCRSHTKAHDVSTE